MLLISPITPKLNTEVTLYPFDSIRTLINFYKSDLIIVDTGRSTSLATAYTLFRDEMNIVGGFYVMGGAFFTPGNVTPLAEANFFGDPASTNVILNKAHNLTITPLNVTNYAYLKPEIIESLSKNKKNPFNFLIKPIFDYYYQAYKKLVPGIVGAPIHDLVTMMIVAQPNIVKYINYDAKVSENADTKGMSYIDVRLTSKTGKTRIAIELNYGLFIREFERIMLLSS